MTSRKYPRLSDGYHERSPYHPYQSSGKYPKNHVNSLSESREESLGSNSTGYTSRGGSPSSRSYTSSPRTYRSKPSHGRSKESSKRGSSRSPENHHGSTHRSNSTNHTDREHGKNNHAPQEQDDFAWSQHVSSSGKVYYYNCKTEKSQWEKPKEWIEREMRLAKDKEKREHDLANVKEGRELTNSREFKDSRENSSHVKEYKNIKDQTHFKDSQYSKSKFSVSSTGNMSNKSSSREHYYSQHNDMFSNRDANKFNSDRFYGGEEKATGNSESLRRQEIIKTSSAHTSAIPTTVYRSGTYAAVPRSDPIVSPAGSLQDVSPPATPSCPTSFDLNMHTVSPQLNSTTPTTLHHHSLSSPSLIHHQAAVISSSSVHPHNIPPGIQSMNYLPRPVMEQVQQPHSGYYVTSQLTNNRLPAISHPVVNFNSQLSATPLHPLQQATLLQQRQMSEAHVIQGVTSQPLPISVHIPVMVHNDGISKSVSNSSSVHNDHRQSSSCPVSPVGFMQSVPSHHFHPISSKQVQSSHQHHPPASPHILSPLPSPTPISLQSLGRFYDKNLIMNTIVNPQIELYEKQALKAWDETIIQSEDGLQVKGYLLQSQLNLHLADLKGDIGNKRIVFLREQTRTLDALLSESNTKSLM